MVLIILLLVHTYMNLIIIINYIIKLQHLIYINDTYMLPTMVLLKFIIQLLMDKLHILLVVFIMVIL